MKLYIAQSLIQAQVHLKRRKSEELRVAQRVYIYQTLCKVKEQEIYRSYKFRLYELPLLLVSAVIAYSRVDTLLT